MSQLVFENLIELAKNVHESHSEVREFFKFPNDLKTQEVKKKSYKCFASTTSRQEVSNQ